MIDLKAYYCESASRWFVVRCNNKKIAASVAVQDFGRGRTRAVREATEKEVKQYRREHGANEETIS